jgi:probable O-glycosylation ligase (exosortase A-associated)
LMLIVTPRQLRVLIWVVTFSIAFFGIKGGVFTVLTGGASRVWGPPGGMVEENNALAVCLVMLTPILHFLRQTETRRWVRHFLLFCIVAVVFSILGSQSRGALLSLLSMALFLGLKGKYPVRSTLAFGTLIVLAIAFMPDSWTARMETMQTYTTDDSAMSRVWTWQTMWNVALDRPLVGAGLSSDNPAVFARYAPLDGPYAVFAGRVYVAHSIYFQMLGEHGFIGLGLFLLLGFLTWRMASRLARATKEDAEFGHWVPLLMRMVQVSLVGYATGGAFLSLAYFDVPYYFVGFVVLCDVFVRGKQRRGSENRVPAAAARTAGLAVAVPSRSTK